MAVMDVGQLSMRDERNRHAEVGGSQQGLRKASGQGPAAGVTMQAGGVTAGRAANERDKTPTTPSVGGGRGGGGGSGSGAFENARNDGFFNLGGAMGPQQAGAGMNQAGPAPERVSTPYNPWTQMQNMPGVGDNDLKQQGLGKGGEGGGGGASKGGDSHAGESHGNDNAKSLWPTGTLGEAPEVLRDGKLAIKGPNGGKGVPDSIFSSSAPKQQMMGADGKPIGPAR